MVLFRDKNFDEILGEKVNRRMASCLMIPFKGNIPIGRVVIPKKHSKLLYSNCFGTVAYTLGMDHDRIDPVNTEDKFSRPLDNRPGYLSPSLFMDLVSETYRKTATPIPGDIIEFVPRLDSERDDLGGPIHAGIYLGENNPHGNLFHQKSYGEKFEIGVLKDHSTFLISHDFYTLKK